MKKILFIASVILLTLQVQGKTEINYPKQDCAQKQDCSSKQHPKFTQKMKQSKFDEIVKIMHLDQEKAQAFSTIYYPFEVEMEQIFASKIKARQFKNDITEEESKAILDEIIRADRKQAEIFEKYHKDLSRIFTAKERLQIISIEKEIHKKIIMEAKDRNERKPKK